MERYSWLIVLLAGCLLFGTVSYSQGPKRGTPPQKKAPSGKPQKDVGIVPGDRAVEPALLPHMNRPPSTGDPGVPAPGDETDEGTGGKSKPGDLHKRYFIRRYQQMKAEDGNKGGLKQGPMGNPMIFNRDNSASAPAWIDNMCFRFKLKSGIPTCRTKIYISNVDQQNSVDVAGTTTNIIADSFCGMAFMADGNWFNPSNTRDKLLKNHQLCVVGNLNGDADGLMQNIRVDDSAAYLRSDDYLQLFQLQDGRADFYIRNHLEIIFFNNPGSQLNQHIFNTKVATVLGLTVEEQKKLFAKELWSHSVSNIKVIFKPDANVDGYSVDLPPRAILTFKLVLGNVIDIKQKKGVCKSKKIDVNN